MFGSGTESDELVMSDRLRAHFEELTATAMSEHFGPDGIPKAITFDEIESLGHQLAQKVAEKFSHAATSGHQRHFQNQQPCPGCGSNCEAEDPVERKILTRLGFCRISEIKFHCNACRRSFFPGTGRLED